MRNRRIGFRATVCVATVLGASGAAGAQDGEPPVEESGEPVAESGEPVEETAAPAAASTAPALLLPGGALQVRLGLGVGLSEELAPGVGGSGNPIVIAPDLWYAINDQVSIGLTHSFYGQTAFWTGLPGGLAGSSLCVAGDACGDDVYSTGGVQAVTSLFKSDTVALAGGAGVYYNVVDPFRVGLGVGAQGMWSANRVSVTFTPNVYVGLNERDGEALADGTVVTAPNKEYLFAPLTVMYEVALPFRVGVQTGVISTFDAFAESYLVPLGIGANLYLSEALMVGGAFTLERVLGGAPDGAPEPDATDLRSLAIWVEWTRY